MASIDRRPSGKYLARWREFPGGPQRTKTFARKVDAERFLIDIQHRLLSGSYTPPSAGQVTVADYAAEWTARRHWAPSTADRVERELRLHILPALGQRPLSSLRRAHVEEWAAGLELAPSSVEAVVGTLAAMLSAAVTDERIARNPASGARLPRTEGAPVVPLTVTRVHGVASAMPEHVRAAVVVVAGTGLRQGELFGLCADRVDFLGRELRVDRQLWTPRRGAPVLRPPKSRNSFRNVALSSVVVDALAAHLAAFGPGRDGLVFHYEGRPIVRAQGSKYARKAGTGAGLKGFGWHDLRHHHASVLLSRGISPALVAERLGHDIKTLLRTYAHVIRSDEDKVRAVVDETLGQTAEDWLRTEGVS
jgi:integrase